MPKNANKEAALRKRQLISKANKIMFFWVAGASAAVGIALVVTYSLFQHMMFNDKVLKETYVTIDNLKHNNSVAEEIKSNVRVLNTNQALLNLRVEGDSEPVQVILDALPASANSAALGASLQSEKLLSLPGSTIESLKVDSASGETAGSDGQTTVASNAGSQVQFSFTVNTPSGDGSTKMKEVMQALERSIRDINLTDISIERQGDKFTMTAKGYGSYQPGIKVEMGEKSVSPKATPQKAKGSKK